MKKRCLSTVLFLLSGLLLFAQDSILESLGGAKINLKITTAEKTILNDEEQYIIPRAVHEREIEVAPDGVSAYGYRPFHLEFFTYQEIEKGDKKGRYRYELKFFDANEQHLFSRFYNHIKIVPFNSVKTGHKFALSINLYGIPLVIFDQVRRIDITEI